MSEHISDFNVISRDMELPLNAAIQSGNTKLVRYLLQKGADLNCFGGTRYNPIMTAFLVNASPSIINLLLLAGAELHVSNQLGETITSCAVTSGNLALLKYLKDKHAFYDNHALNKQDSDGYDVFLYAVKHNNINLVLELLEQGYDNINRINSCSNVCHC